MSLCQEGGAGGGLEDLPDTLVGPGRALQVLVGADLLANFLTLLTRLLAHAQLFEMNGSTYLFGRDGGLRSLVQFFDGLGIMTKILLAADKDDGKALAEVQNLGDPLDNNVSNTLIVLDRWFKPSYRNPPSLGRYQESPANQQRNRSE